MSFPFLLSNPDSKPAVEKQWKECQTVAFLNINHEPVRFRYRFYMAPWSHRCTIPGQSVTFEQFHKNRSKYALYLGHYL